MPTETTREPDRYELAPDALERIARAFEANPTAQHSGAAVASILRYLAKGTPAAAPATEREPEIVEGCEHNPPHLRMRPPSEPAAPTPDWSVRAGDKCTRIGCDKKVIAACLPHQFGGCDEHMREHDSRCTFAPLDRTASPVAQGKEKG